MRAVFVGGSALTVMTARLLLRHGHEVVIIEQSEERIRELIEDLGCGFIHGDGTKPAILKEANPGITDFLFCLTGDDRTNILASLVGRSLKFPQVVTQIYDPEFEHLCSELGLEHTVVPVLAIGRLLADAVEGRDPLEISAMIRGEAAVFMFVAGEDDAGAAGDLKLPADTRLICVYRGDEFVPVTAKTRIKPADEVLLITKRDTLPKLRERWTPGVR